MTELPRFLRPTVMHDIVVRTIKGRRLFRPVPENVVPLIAAAG